MVFPIWMEIIIALLAVFGVYAIVRVVTGSVFAMSNLATAIRIRTSEDAEMLEVYLREAEDAFFLRGKQRIIVLFESGVIDGVIGCGNVPDEETVALLGRYGAEYCIVG